jgi:hypothetical protein
MFIRKFKGRRNVSRGVIVFEKGSEKEVGTIEKALDYEPSSRVANIDAPDISLMRPTQPGMIDQVTSPIPNLKWISDADWNRLKATRHAKFKILGGDSIAAEGIRSGSETDITVLINFPKTPRFSVADSLIVS